jgi:hypothetical protein
MSYWTGYSPGRWMPPLVSDHDADQIPGPTLTTRDASQSLSAVGSHDREFGRGSQCRQASAPKRYTRTARIAGTSLWTFRDDPVDPVAAPKSPIEVCV